VGGVDLQVECPFEPQRESGSGSTSRAIRIAAGQQLAASSNGFVQAGSCRTHSAPAAASSGSQPALEPMASGSDQQLALISSAAHVTSSLSHAGSTSDDATALAATAFLPVTVTSMQFSSTPRRQAAPAARVRLVCAHLSPSRRCAFVPLADLAQMALRPGGAPLQADKLAQSYGKCQQHIAHTRRKCGCKWPGLGHADAAEAELNEGSALHELRSCF